MAPLIFALALMSASLSTVGANQEAGCAEEGCAAVDAGTDLGSLLQTVASTDKETDTAMETARHGSSDDQAQADAPPGGYMTLGSNTKCRGYGWTANEPDDDKVWPKHDGAQTLESCASACDSSLHESGDCTSIDFDVSTKKCTLYGHKDVVKETEAGSTCYTNGKVYDPASDVWGWFSCVGTSCKHDQAETDKIWAKWNARSTPKQAPNFKVGDLVFMCSWSKAELQDESGKDHCHRDGDKEFWIEPAKVVEVLGGGKYAIDHQDGRTGYEEFDFSVTSEQEAVVYKAAGADCTGKFYLDVQGSPLAKNATCVEDCPPGFLEGKDGVCRRCYGLTSRRRAKKCHPCAAGHVSRSDSDTCQNVQDTCDKEQCGPCKDCLDLLGPTITGCAQQSNNNCYDPGNSWCAGAQEGLMRCQSKSLGCFYKLVCQAKCVCSSWKNIFCGGRTGNEECPASMLIQNASQTAPRSLSDDAPASLEESLAGKRSC